MPRLDDLAGAVNSLRQLIHLFHDSRDHLVQVTYNTDIRDIKDRRILVGVDGNDQAGVLHSCCVLDRSADPAGKVDLWLYRGSCLPYLVCMVDPALVYCCSGRCDGPSELLCQLL